MPGTLVWRRDLHVGLVNHYGVVLTDDLHIAHIDKASAGHLRVKIEAAEKFAAGQPWFYEPRAAPVALDAMWPRVEQVRKERRPFGLLCWGESWNCESFARYVRDGIAQSLQAASANQVLGVVALVAFVGFIVGVASSDSA